MEKQSARGKIRYAEYGVEKMMGIKKLIARHTGTKPKRYSILVDDEMVVEITTDIDRFDEYLAFVDAHTSEIEVRLYFGNSPHHNKRIFTFPPAGLSGLDQPAVIGDRKLWELERNAEENKKKIKKYKRLCQEQQEEIEELKEQIEELSDRADTRGMIESGLTKVAAIFSKGKDQNNTNQLKGNNEVKGEVKIEGIDEESTSSVAQDFDKLMKEFNVQNPNAVIKMNAIILENPQLQQQIYQLINKKS